MSGERPTCSSCWYFEPNPTVNVASGDTLPNKNWGECHHGTPRASRFWPNVLRTDWCGKHPKFFMWTLAQGMEKQQCESGSSEVHYITESQKLESQGQSG